MTTNVKGIVYLDDFMFTLDSVRAATRFRDRHLLPLFSHLDMRVSPTKGSLMDPSPRVELLGSLVDTRLMRVFIPAERRTDLLTKLDWLSSPSPRCSVQALSSFVGKVTALRHSLDL